ncbi:MAG: hypothetical protein H7A51_01560 [Akkermansiaceae bacterium]|nr:hypothetical protein [Akkermansiaceae bacterium]
MEANPNNPKQGDENYSVDEMMARLKRNDRQKRADSSSREEGELITRPDGSQVVKVRRRKRRSKQPEKKQKQTNPKIKWAVLGSLIGLFVILIAGTIFIIAKYNGRSFKETTESTVTKLAGAESTELTQLRVTPVSAKASKAELSWDKHSFFKSATFNAIKADIKATSFFTSDWIGEEVVASLGKVQLQTPAVTVETSTDPILSPYSFGAFRCNQLDIQFGADRNSPAITGLQVSLRKQVDDHYQIVFNNGLMNVPNWPALEISSGIMSLNSSDTEIEARLEASNGLKGELVIKGRIAKSTDSPIVLDVKAKDYPIQQLLGKELGRIIQGEIQSDMGSLSYDYKKKNTEALSFILPFNSTELRFSELPMFTDLKDVTRDTQYVRPTFSSCRGTIMRTSDGVTLSNLILTSSRIITLNGDISVSALGVLSGELTVGIPARIFTKNLPAPTIFSEPHAGFIYTKVTLSGSINNPHDNLNELLQASNPTPQPSPTPGPGAGLLDPRDKTNGEARQKEKDFEELTR